MAIEYFDAAGSATAQGLFIPASDLAGLLATELEAGDSEEAKFSAFVYSFFKKLKASLTRTSYLNNQTSGNKLGLAYTQVDDAPEENVHEITIGLNTQLLMNKGNQKTAVLPLNDSGSGSLTFKSICSNAAKVEAAGAVAEAGVVIPTADLVMYGSPDHATIDVTADSRQLITAIWGMCYDMATVRDNAGTISSAFSGKNKVNTFPTITTALGTAIPTATGIDDTYKSYAIAQEALTLTIELLLDDDDTHSPYVRLTPQ